MKEKRAKLILICFLIYFFVIVFRIFSLQIIYGSDFEKKSISQREALTKIPASRGQIFASDGFPLAENQISYILNFDKNLNNNTKISTKIVNKISDILLSDTNIFVKTDDKNKIKERKTKVIKYISNILNNKNIKAGVVYKKLQEKTKIGIDKLNVPIFYFTTEELRRYPESSMSAHILGFLGRNEKDELTGYFGLEGFFNQELKGVDGFKIFEKDPLGAPILLKIYEKKNPINGRSLLTSIDRGANKILDKWVEWGVRTYSAKSGSALLYDPWTGEIIAASVFPGFDPNNYYLFDDFVKKNILISDEYEPGSIMKPLIMAAALNERLINAKTKCPVCSKPIEKSGFLIRTYDDTYIPNLQMDKVLERSDNTGMTYIGDLLGKKRLLSYLDKLGFGKITKVDLEGEVSGFIKKPENIYDIDLSTMTFGQGLTVTSVQMVKAWGSLVTGKTYEPHVTTAFLSDTNKNTIYPKVEKEIFTRNVIAEIKNMLINVTDNGELHFARDKIPGLNKYRIASKSGTAQIAINGEYAKDITLGSTIGYAPADDPKFILLVKLDEAKANQWGANTAGAVFFNIWNELFQYYNIPPE